MAIERFGDKPDDPERGPGTPEPDDARPDSSTPEGEQWGSGGHPITPRARPVPAAESTSPGAATPGTPWPEGLPEPEADDRPVAADSGPTNSGSPTGRDTPGGFGTPTEPGAPGGFGAPAGTGDPQFTPGAFEMPAPSLDPAAAPVPATFDPPAPRRGRMQVQQAGVTQPRPPTVAEARAREKAQRRAQEQAQAEIDAAEDKRKKRKKLLIGGVAVVGVAALVGGGYLAYSALTAPEVTAYCTVVANKGQTVALGNGQSIVADHDGQEIIVADDSCQKATSSGTYNSGFGGVYIFNGGQYRYYYGGSGADNTLGKAPSGGTTVTPKGASIKTKSGSTIQRGGLGAKIGGSSGS
ncbi:hypothetical protein [Nocardia jejuensis]|uniref:hypothetical protein n=1 Tax=Nocardia jejuensis TaxID=328049 RepID=UPI000AEB2C3E|nr:hypothetical protein [Nocardia jejuensis]